MLAKRGVEVLLLFGARTEQELLYDADFRAFETATPGFRYFACLSRAERAEPRANDRRGYVQMMLEEAVPNAAGDIAYLCGNPDMVDQAFTLLKDASLPVPHIRREKYVSSR